MYTVSPATCPVFYRRPRDRAAIAITSPLGSYRGTSASDRSATYSPRLVAGAI